MTQDEIIKMAVQAELNLYVHDLTEKQYIEVIKHFAKLVAAKTIAELENQEPVKYEHKAYTMPPCPKCRSFFCDHTCKVIKELESQEPYAWVAEDVCKGQIIYGRPRKIWWECEKGVGKAIYTHPPQRTEQEPVGWIDSKGNMLCVKINESCRPLYAHPPQRTEQEPVIDKSAAIRIATSLGWSPQRTWIGLTDDEFNELYDRYVPLTCYALLIEKVEAKLKEKNRYAEENT
jgi:hypothetical protein